jgi:hypothetical protein
LTNPVKKTYNIVALGKKWQYIMMIVRLGGAWQKITAVTVLRKPTDK